MSDFKCSQCEEMIEFNEGDIGNIVNCPKCKQSLRVPEIKEDAQETDEEIKPVSTETKVLKGTIGDLNEYTAWILSGQPFRVFGNSRTKQAGFYNSSTSPRRSFWSRFHCSPL